MLFAGTPRLAVLLLAVVSVAVSADVSLPSEKPETTTEDDKAISKGSNNNSTEVPDRIQIQKIDQNDDNDVAPSSDVTIDDLLFFESLISDDKIIEENDQRNSIPSRSNTKEKLQKADSNSENPVESKISTDVIDIRRQGEQNPKLKPEPDSQSDDSKEEKVTDSPPRFGQRRSKQRIQDDAPVLRLIPGGYDRPFKRHRFRNRYMSRPESSEQSSQIQEPDQNSNENRPPQTRRVVPQVTYSSSLQQPFAFGTRPVLNPSLEAQRNMIAIHHVMPSTIQNAFFNPPQGGLTTDYTNVPFQAHFPQNNEVGGFPNFGRDLNNAALYQASPSNPFQTPGVLFQTAPEAQTQPVLMDPARNVQPQFQSNPFTPYPGYENAEDTSRPNYAALFRNPVPNRQFQVPSNFYTSPPNGVNAFSSPPISFLSNYPNSDDNLSSRFFRYPVTTESQSNRQSSSDEQPDSAASQEDKNTKAVKQETDRPSNRNYPSVAIFGARLPEQNEADVYMRYPTNKAGYGIEENLPAQNNSNEAKDNSQEVNSEQRNFRGVNPFRNALDSARSNQRLNTTFEFPPELFRDGPIEFGYQRPQSQIFSQYPDSNRGIQRYPSPTFESRGAFDPIASLPENNYQFLNLDNQRGGHRRVDGTPSCAKQNNASVCFEDSEYPGNDVLYSLNSNSFLADRLSAAEVPLNSVNFVQRSTNTSDQDTEDYACPVDVKYGSPLRAKNVEGEWRIIVNVQGKFSQPVRMEVCKSLGDPCSYVDSRTKTTCVQKFSLYRLLSWMPGRGIYSEVYKLPVACSCQILKET